jgi:hypothetical protein
MVEDSRFRRELTRDVAAVAASNVQFDPGLCGLPAGQTGDVGNE